MTKCTIVEIRAKAFDGEGVRKHEVSVVESVVDNPDRDGQKRSTKKNAESNCRGPGPGDRELHLRPRSLPGGHPPSGKARDAVARPHRAGRGDQTALLYRKRRPSLRVRVRERRTLVRGRRRPVKKTLTEVK